MTIHWGLKTRNDRSVQETEQYLYRFFFFTSDAPHGPTVLSAFTTADAWRVFFLLYGGSQTYKCINATYLSNGPLTLYLQSQLGESMVHAFISLRSAVKQEEDAPRAGCCERAQDSWTVRCIRGKKQYKYGSVSCTDRLFVSLDLSVSSRDAGFNLVLSVYVCFSQSRESHWLPLYNWQTATVWVKNINLCSTEETKSPTSWMPCG